MPSLPPAFSTPTEGSAHAFGLGVMSLYWNLILPSEKSVTSKWLVPPSSAMVMLVSETDSKQIEKASLVYTQSSSTARRTSSAARHQGSPGGRRSSRARRSTRP